jgi:hypothetical protein
MARRIVDNLGPAMNHPPVAAAAALSDEIFKALHKARGGPERKNETQREHLLTRFIYLAESTSTGIRMNATWTLILPAMSLLRDRYEQVVRFSWLSRQTDLKQLIAFLDHFHVRSSVIFGDVSPAQWAQLEDVLPNKIEPPKKLTKEEKTFLARWEKLDLRSMATKRDALPAKTKSPIEEQTLADLYTPVYQQFSSVSHGDAFGLDILRLWTNSAGVSVLSPDPWWPAFICLFNCLFDLIQCHEAVSAFPLTPKPPQLDEFLPKFITLKQKIITNAPD